MNDDLLEQKLGEILETAQPVEDLPPTTRTRVLSTLTDSTAGRAKTRKPRWRLATALGVMAVALFALGFVPFRTGDATGTLTRAIAAFDQLLTKHTIRHSWDNEGNEYLTETWSTAGGFMRQDEFKEGELSHVQIMDGSKMLSISVGENGQFSAIEYYRPHGDTAMNLPMGELATDRVSSIFSWLNSLDVYESVTVNEYQERSLWGGAINIAEVETDHGDAGYGQKWRFEIDPATDRVMKSIFYMASGTAEIWEKKSATDYEWDVTIPESTHDFVLPAGTTLTRQVWWQDKVDKVLAQSSTPNWEVILHDVQIDNQGNMTASISTHQIVTGEDSYHGGSGFPKITVTDNLGNKYCNGNSGGVDGAPGHIYWTIPITRNTGERVGTPTSATFTINLDETTNDQVVVLRNIPLPSRQPLSREEITHKDDEVVQY